MINRANERHHVMAIYPEAAWYHRFSPRVSESKMHPKEYIKILNPVTPDEVVVPDHLPVYRQETQKRGEREVQVPLSDLFSLL